MPAASFYRPLAGAGSTGRFEATASTAGPWDAHSQHGGPPSALLARAMEAVDPRPDAAVVRVALDILGPLPLGEVTVTAGVLRAGRSVELLGAELSAGGRVVLRAAGWRVRAVPSDVPADVPADLPADVVTSAPAGRSELPAPDDTAGGDPGWVSGYVSAIEWRWVRGHFLERGPATVWTRMRVPLVADELPTPLQRALVVVDSGNGASNLLDIDEWLFVNPELTYHVARPAVGEWLCLESVTTLTAGGPALARTTLSDVSGVVGYGAQSLFVTRRPPP